MILVSALHLPCFSHAVGYTAWDMHLCMGSPSPAVHAKWSLVFWSFATSSQRLKTALSLVFSNNLSVKNIQKCFKNQVRP